MAESKIREVPVLSAGTTFTLTPIGVVRSDRRERIDDDWDARRSTIELDPSFDPSCLDGLLDFSHAEILYLFDRVAEGTVERGARHPRGNPDWPRVGVFAQRAKDRPNVWPRRSSAWPAAKGTPSPSSASMRSTAPPSSTSSP